MARRSTRAAKKKSVNIDFSNIGKQFEEDMEYAIEVAECTLEDGNEYPYFAFKLKGADEEYENSIMYHNASTSPQSLWRLKPLLEAFGMDVPDGPLDLDPDDFVGMKAMCSTIKEKKPGGGTSIRPEEFWPMDEDEEEEKPSKKGASKKAAKKEAIDLDDISDADIKKLAKEFGLKGRDADKLREELKDADDDELAEAIEELGIEAAPAEEEEEKPARGRRSKAKEEDDEEEPKGKAGRSSRGSKASKKKPDITEEEVQEMSEEELEDLIEQYELDVDLDEHRTLRKKKVAVVDALQEAGVIAD